MAGTPTGKKKGAAEATAFWKQALGSPENNKERKEESGVYVGEALAPYTHETSTKYLAVGVH